MQDTPTLFLEWDPGFWESNRMWMDTHAHLSDPQFDPDRDEIIRGSIELGISTIIEIADGPQEWEKAKALSHRFNKNIWWTGGIHPYYSDQASASVLAQLVKCSQDPRFVAVGEVGLDYAKCPIPPEIQIETFKKTIDLALNVKKPLVIHCREAFPDLLKILNGYQSELRGLGPSGPGVIHCFSGTSGDAEQLLQWGFYLGVDGPLTYPKSDSLRKIMGTIPLESIVLETDSPYLPPQNFRGKRNDSRHLPLIGQKLAEIRNMRLEALGKVVTKNGQTLFRII